MFSVAFKQLYDKENLPNTNKEEVLRKVVQLGEMKKPLFISDITMTPILEAAHLSRGETAPLEFKYESMPVLTRLIDHIGNLIFFANQYHREQYCFMGATGKFQLKPEMANKITRIGTYEFAMYPKKEPLNKDDFQLLLNAIEKMAAECHENLHLALGSFPLVDRKNKLYNCVLYVQCGKEPKANICAKAQPFFCHDPESSEIIYPGTQSARRDLNKGKDILDIPLWFEWQNSTVNVTYNPIIRSTTAGGVPFLIMLEICRDHHAGVAKTLFMHELSNTDYKDREFYPLQVTHVITANSTEVKAKNVFGKYVTHIDPQGGIYSKFDLEDEIPRVRVSPQLFSQMAENNAAVKNKYKELRIEQVGLTLSVISPSFGGSYQLQVYAERACDFFDKSTLDKINEINKKIAEKSIKAVVSTQQWLEISSANFPQAACNDNYINVLSRQLDWINEQATELLENIEEYKLLGEFDELVDQCKMVVNQTDESVLSKKIVEILREFNYAADDILNETPASKDVLKMIGALPAQAGDWVVNNALREAANEAQELKCSISAQN